MTEQQHDEKRRWLRLNVRVTVGMTGADATVSIKKDDIRALKGDMESEEEVYRELLATAFNTSVRSILEKLSKIPNDDLEFDPRNIRKQLNGNNGIGFQAKEKE